MPTTLLLRLPAHDQDETEWLSVDESGIATAPRQRGTLARAAAAAGGATVIALAPAAQVLLAAPELPPGSGAKLLRAVPFALEEYLTEDIDQLHFAVGRRGANSTTPVAVVSRAAMQGWSAMLAAAGIEASTLYADMSLLPNNPSQTVLWLEQDRVAVRRPQALPVMIEISPIGEALAIAGLLPDSGADPLAAQTPENVLLYATPADWARVQPEVEALAGYFASFKVQLLPDGPLPWLARELRTGDALNLMQGEYASGPDYAVQWRQWRTAALLAGALLVVHVAAQALQIHQANKQIAALDTEIAQVYATAMPAEPMHEPRKQMQSRLDRIRKSSIGPQYFLHSVQAVSAAMAGVPQTTIEALSYREHTLDLKLTAGTVDAVSRIAQAVVKQGLNADIQSSTPVAGGIEAHMQIQPQGAKAHR